jgi:ABC-type Zn2+ transport system substrate-binding protein/surface adhesin
MCSTLWRLRRIRNIPRAIEIDSVRRARKFKMVTGTIPLRPHTRTYRHTHTRTHTHTHTHAHAHTHTHTHTYPHVQPQCEQCGCSPVGLPVCHHAYE